MSNDEVKRARYVRSLEWRGDARLYKLSPPMRADMYGEDSDEVTADYDYVVVSAVDASYSGPETYIFGSNKDGECPSMLELPGSFKGGKDHALALARAGYALESYVEP
jgi:hypothetical protein